MRLHMPLCTFGTVCLLGGGFRNVRMRPVNVRMCGHLAVYANIGVAACS
jgi:hypothetical protein